MKPLSYIFAIVFAGILLSSCKKNHDVLGADVQPQEDLLNASFSDTSQIYAHTTTHSVIASFNDGIKYLGCNCDPYFGKTNVGLYVNANLPNGLIGVTFPANANLVSSEIILAVPSLQFIGNNTLTLNYVVHPVTSVLTNTVLHYTSNDSLYDKTTVVGSYNGALDVINGKLVLRIPIDNNYAKSILNNSSVLADNATFQSVYKGFYITAEGSTVDPAVSQGFISKFDMDDDLSGFYLYYQLGTPSSTKENLKFKFDFKGNDAVRFNRVKYDPTGCGVSNLTLVNQLLVPDSTYGKQNIYVKGLGGTKVKFYIPSLKSYADSFKVAVNRAEIIFNIDATFTTTAGQYIPPTYLTILPADSLGRETFALDQLTATDFARYGGVYDEDNKRYVFNIARHVQAIMNGTRKNYGFYLVVANPDVNYTGRRDNYEDRVILAGSQNTTLRPKLNLSFVKFKNDK